MEDEAEEPQRAAIRACFRRVLNFPKAGQPFLDISRLLANPAAYAACVQLLVEKCRAANVGAVAAFEARGFFFGPPVALVRTAAGGSSCQQLSRHSARRWACRSCRCASLASCQARGARARLLPG